MLPRARHARYAIATAAAAALATAAPGQLRVVNYNVAGLQGDLSVAASTSCVSRMNERTARSRASE